MLKKIAFAIILPVFLVTFGVGFWIYQIEYFLNNAFVKKEVRIQKNEPFSSVYKKIFTDMQTPKFFEFYLKKVRKFPEKIRYGYYEADNKTIEQFLADIENGKESRLKLTIPEGYNLYDIAKKIESLEIMDKERFLKLTHDKEFVSKVTSMDIDTLEGFIFPDTYFVTTDIKEEEFIYQAYRNFIQKLPDNFEMELKKRGLTFYQGVILASIIQKETYIDSEYPLVASVFYNRIKKKMRLQSDPTIIYGIYDRFNGNIKKVDILDSSNRYNTYQINGLPPTPICNPSIGALMAVIKPAETDYLFFVSKNDGSHIFVKSYEEHQKNVRNYQLGKK